MSYSNRFSISMMLVLLCILIFIYHFGVGIYYVLGQEPLPTFEFLYTAGFLSGVVWWLKSEERKSALKNIYCPGLLVGIGWLVMIPYQLLKTRGVRALIPLAALLGSFLAAKLSALILYVIFSPVE